MIIGQVMSQFLYIAKYGVTSISTQATSRMRNVKMCDKRPSKRLWFYVISYSHWEQEIGCLVICLLSSGFCIGIRRASVVITTFQLNEC